MSNHTGWHLPIGYWCLLLTIWRSQTTSACWWPSSPPMPFPKSTAHAPDAWRIPHIERDRDSTASSKFSCLRSPQTLGSATSGFLSSVIEDINFQKRRRFSLHGNLPFPKWLRSWSKASGEMIVFTLLSKPACKKLLSKEKLPTVYIVTKP